MPADIVVLHDAPDRSAWIVEAGEVALARSGGALLTLRLTVFPLQAQGDADACFETRRRISQGNSANYQDLADEDMRNVLSFADRVRNAIVRVASEAVLKRGLQRLPHLRFVCEVVRVLCTQPALSQGGPPAQRPKGWSTMRSLWTSCWAVAAAPATSFSMCNSLDAPARASEAVPERRRTRLKVLLRTIVKEARVAFRQNARLVNMTFPTRSVGCMVFINRAHSAWGSIVACECCLPDLGWSRLACANLSHDGECAAVDCGGLCCPVDKRAAFAAVAIGQSTAAVGQDERRRLSVTLEDMHNVTSRLCATAFEVMATTLPGMLIETVLQRALCTLEYMAPGDGRDVEVLIHSLVRASRRSSDNVLFMRPALANPIQIRDRFGLVDLAVYQTNVSEPKFMRFATDLSVRQPSRGTTSFVTA